MCISCYHPNLLEWRTEGEDCRISQTKFGYMNHKKNLEKVKKNFQKKYLREKQKSRSNSDLDPQMMDANIISLTGPRDTKITNILFDSLIFDFDPKYIICGFIGTYSSILNE